MDASGNAAGYRSWRQSISVVRAHAPGGVRACKCDVYVPAQEERESEIERAGDVRGCGALAVAVARRRAAVRAEVVEDGPGLGRVEQRVGVPDREAHRRLRAVVACVGRAQLDLGGGTEPRRRIAAAVSRIAA